MKEQLRVLKLAWAPMFAGVVPVLSPLAAQANCNEVRQVGDYLGRSSRLDQAPRYAAEITPRLRCTSASPMCRGEAGSCR